MKHLFVTILLLCAVNLNLSAQYDPCGELRVAMLTADRLLFEGKLDEALTKLNKFKNDPEMQNCPEMKNGVLDFKINEIQKKMNPFCPDDKHPHLIDLGLPSGTKWACCNVDAKKPEEYGGYYAWGETVEKDVYKWETYKHCDGTWEHCHNIGKNICGTKYDVAYVKWGGSWRMPTLKQYFELLDNCSSEWINLNGVVGRSFTSKKNGRSIFLPTAGERDGSNFYKQGVSGSYWLGSRSPVGDKNRSYIIVLRSEKVYYEKDTYRYGGLSVRPVAK